MNELGFRGSDSIIRPARTTDTTGCVNISRGIAGSPESCLTVARQSSYFCSAAGAHNRESWIRRLDAQHSRQVVVCGERFHCDGVTPETAEHRRSDDAEHIVWRAES
jgi:hypothetical protein